MNKWGRKNSKILFSTVTNGSFQMEMPLDSTSVNWPWNFAPSLNEEYLLFLLIQDATEQTILTVI